MGPRSQEDFTAPCGPRPLLLSGFYIVPLFHTEDQWIAYASWLGRPEEVPLFGISNVTPIELWWKKRDRT